MIDCIASTCVFTHGFTMVKAISFVNLMARYFELGCLEGLAAEALNDWIKVRLLTATHHLIFIFATLAAVRAARFCFGRTGNSWDPLWEDFLRTLCRSTARGTERTRLFPRHDLALRLRKQSGLGRERGRTLETVGEKIVGLSVVAGGV